MSTAVMTLGALQQHRPLQQLQPAKKMVMMLSPPHDLQHAQLVQPSNGACVIVSANGLATGYYPPSPPHFTNLDSPTTTTSVASAQTVTTNSVSNNNTAKAKNNNLNKVSRVGGGAVQKPAARTSVVVAAAPVVSSTATSAAASAEALRCKRRIQFAAGGAAGGPVVGAQAVSFSGHQTASVARRNARERNRVKQVNNGFATLRSHIPPAIAAALQESSGGASSGGSSSSSERGGSSRGQTAKEKEAAKKLSKVETLRMAVEYIRRLQALLNETTGNNENADPGTPVTVKTESVVMPDSPSGFDADYEAALALSHYSMAPESTTSSSPSSVAVAGGVTTLSSTASVLAGLHHPHFVSMSPPCSDAGSSPTPSYVSDGSAGASSTGYAPAGGYVTSTALPCGPCRPAHLAGLSPHTPPDSATLYEPMSPEDEELLDVISWWQQSN